MQRFTSIIAWQRAHRLALEIYRETASFPSDEKYGLVSQMRRASVSIPANIAEGSKRVSRREYARFLNVAEASCAELGYLLMMSRDLGYVRAEQSAKLLHWAEEVSKMLSALRERVEERSSQRR